MDSSERIIFDYLTEQGHAPTDHPDGLHNPPDLLINGTIAIEVRRLNQNYFNGERHHGVEERDKALRSIFDEVLAAIGPPVDGNWYWVSYRFSNPLPVPKDLKRRLKNAISTAKTEELQSGISIGLLKVAFHLSDVPLSQRFTLGLYVNRNRGGWVISEMIRNLPICIDEKAAKIARVKDRYPEWWLALVDEINHGSTDDSNAEVIRENVKVRPPWTKIIIVGANTRGFEL